MQEQLATGERSIIIMKTIEEFIREISESKELQEELTSIIKDQPAEVGAFLQKHDCLASAEEFMNILKSQKESQSEGEISDEDVEAIAGGGAKWIEDMWDWITKIW